MKNVDTQARKLVALLGVPWEERCLDLHRNARAVRTPSRWQVREPSSSGFIGRWRRCAAHLPRLLQAFPQ